MKTKLNPFVIEQVQIRISTFQIIWDKSWDDTNKPAGCEYND